MAEVDSRAEQSGVGTACKEKARDISHKTRKWKDKGQERGLGEKGGDRKGQGLLLVGPMRMPAYAVETRRGVGGQPGRGFLKVPDSGEGGDSWNFLSEAKFSPGSGSVALVEVLALERVWTEHSGMFPQRQGMGHGCHSTAHPAGLPWCMERQNPVGCRRALNRAPPHHTLLCI